MCELCNVFINLYNTLKKSQDNFAMSSFCQKNKTQEDQFLKYSYEKCITL